VSGLRVLDILVPVLTDTISNVYLSLASLASLASRNRNLPQSFLNMSMVNGPGRTYKYYTGEPLWPFGFGLSYTTFSLKWTPQPPPSATYTLPAGESTASTAAALAIASTTYTVKVTNTGAVAGDEVVLAFFKPDADHTNTGSPVPKKQLFDFKRVHLAAGASTTLTFTVNAEQLALVDKDGHSGLYTGGYDIIFSRGHGTELSTRTRVEVEQKGGMRTKTFRKWW
jgi:hypothetical protein